MLTSRRSRSGGRRHVTDVKIPASSPNAPVAPSCGPRLSSPGWPVFRLASGILSSRTCWELTLQLTCPTTLASAAAEMPHSIRQLFLLQTACLLWLSSPVTLAAPVDFGASERGVDPVSSLRRFAVDPSLPPSRDPFYALPDNLDLYQNGAIVRSRPVNTSFATVTATSAQLLYRTTDALGNASATVTTVFAPKEPASPPRVMVLMGMFASQVRTPSHS